VAGPAIRRGRRAVGQRRAAGTKSSGRGGAIGYISALPRRQAPLADWLARDALPSPIACT